MNNKEFEDLARQAGVVPLKEKYRNRVSTLDLQRFCKSKTPVVVPILSNEAIFKAVFTCLDNPDRFTRYLDSLSKEQKILLKMEVWHFCKKLSDKTKCKQLFSFITKIKL